MRLPPVDDYRTPLVEPLGCLVLHAAKLDNALIEFVALVLLPFGRDTRAEQVAHELRNWNPGFLSRAIDDAVADPAIASDLHDFVRRLGGLRERRHRMIHDAMEVGIDIGPDGSYRAIILRDGYVRHKGTQRTIHKLEQETREEIAALAYEFYEAGLEIDTFLGRLRDSAKAGG